MQGGTAGGFRRQEQGDEAIFAAAWEIVGLADEVRHMDASARRT
jgi:hypothetical protein